MRKSRKKLLAENKTLYEHATRLSKAAAKLVLKTNSSPEGFAIIKATVDYRGFLGDYGELGVTLRYYGEDLSVLEQIT